MEVPSAEQSSEEFSHSFSNDILKIEMAGPQHEHFSVIDLPGLFRSKKRHEAVVNRLTELARAHSGSNHQRRYDPRETDGFFLS